MGKDKANILVELDISQGVNKTEWLPNKTVTKAEAAKFIAKSDSLKIGNPLVEQVIIIDPAMEEQTRKATQGLHESDIVLDTSKRLQSLLEKNTPFRAMLTRETDIRLGENKEKTLKIVWISRKNIMEIFL